MVEVHDAPPGVELLPFSCDLNQELSVAAHDVDMPKGIGPQRVACGGGRAAVRQWAIGQFEAALGAGRAHDLWRAIHHVALALVEGNGRGGQRLAPVVEHLQHDALRQVVQILAEVATAEMVVLIEGPGGVAAVVGPVPVVGSPTAAHQPGAGPGEAAQQRQAFQVEHQVLVTGEDIEPVEVNDAQLVGQLVDQSPVQVGGEASGIVLRRFRRFILRCVVIVLVDAKRPASIVGQRAADDV